jgi:amidase
MGVRVERTQPEALGDLRDYYKLYLSLIAAIESGRLDPEERERRAQVIRGGGDEFLATYADGMTAGAPDVFIWHGRREEYRASFQSFFREWDVLLAPTSFVNAFEHDDRPFHRRQFQIDGQTVYYGRLSVYPGLANLSGHPGTAFPVGLSEQGLPVGLQAIGPYLEDRTPIRFADLVTREFGGFVPPPGYDTKF